MATVLDSFPELFRDAAQLTAGSAHQNWDSAIRVDNPARPGEVVHLFGSGFGRTVLEVPFGEVTPVGESLPVLASPPYACMAQPGNIPLRTFYQGLAPGTIGVYQFDIQMPSDWSDGILRLVCSGDGLGYGGVIAYVPVQ